MDFWTSVTIVAVTFFICATIINVTNVMRGRGSWRL